MKAITTFLLTFAGILSSHHLAAQTATTVPEGLITITVPAGSASNPSITTIGFSLQSKPVAAGTLTAVGTTLDDSSATWTTNAFSNTTTPHLVRITSGTGSGRHFVITSHTSTQLTINTNGLTLSSVVAVGDTYEICPLDTLGSLFGTASVPFLTGASAGSADTVQVWNGTGWTTYFHNGTSWRKTGSFSSQDNVVVPPESGIMVSRIGTTSLNLTFSGEVPKTNLKSLVAGPATTFISNRVPSDIPLSTSGFNGMSGWLTGGSAASADTLQVWNGTGWTTYFHNGTSWRKTGSFSSQDSAVIPAGAAALIQRLSTASGSSASVQHALTYTP